MCGTMPPLPHGVVLKHKDTFDITLKDSVMLHVAWLAKCILCVKTQLAKLFESLGSIMMRSAGLIACLSD